ncbi:MAG: aminoacyl-tRNA hydrolase [Nitrospinota bacterium]
MLVVGLGNPGERYARTRHNVGFRVLDGLAARLDITFRDAGHCSVAGNGSLYGRRVFVAEPLTYMNRSGPAVRGLLRDCRLGPEDLLVVHDDLDIEFGRVRLKRGGGDAGHNGIRSIIEALGSGGFTRLRMGIGRGTDRGKEADYVLSPFTPEELREVEDVIDKGVDRICELIRVWGRDRIPEGPRGERRL